MARYMHYNIEKAQPMKKINSALILMFLNVMAIAQEKTGADVNVDINKDNDGSSFPWLYIIGALVVIILIFALLSGGRGGDRVIERKTIVKE